MFVCVSLVFVNACNIAPRTATQQSNTLPSEIIKSPNDTRQYESIVLNNKLELILVSDPSIEKSAAALSVAVGSYQEPKGFGGLAHYLEHMLFMGTKKYPAASEYSEFIAQNGGEQNAYTDLHYTNYMVAVNNEAFDQALDRFSRFFYQSLLDEKYADKERHSVHSEWTMKSPNDWVILDQLDGLTLNPAHPAYQFNWGNLTSLTDKGPRKLHAELVKLYQSYYSANLMKATLISPLPLAQIKQLANKHFSKIPNKKIPKPKVEQVAALPENLQKIIHYKPQTDMKQLQLKFVIDNNSEQFLVKPNGYVTYLLGNEMPGSLASELRKWALSEAVYADYDADKYGSAGELTLYVDLTEFGVHNRDRVMAAVLAYLSLLKQQGIDKRYFNEIKQSLSNMFRFKQKTEEYSYAMEVAANMQSVPAKYALSSHYQYQTFEPKAIEAVLNQLNMKNLRLFYIDKDQMVDTKMEYFPGRYSISPITPELIRRWQQGAGDFAFSLPKVNSLMPSQFNLVDKVYKDTPLHLIDSKRLSVHLAHSALFSQPKGFLEINFNSNVSKLNAKNHVLADIVNQMLEQDFTALSSEAHTAGMGLNLEVKNGLQISIEGFDDKQQALLKRVVAQLKKMSLNKQQLKNYKQAVIARINSRNKQILLDQLFLKFRQVLNLDNFSDGALLEQVNSISIDDVLNFKQQLFQQANLQVFAFGNYQAIQVKRLVTELVDNLPINKGAREFYLSPELTVPAGKVLSWQQDVDMTDVAFANTYLRPLDIKELATANVLGQIISPALFKQIRTEEQLAYSVGFFSQRINKQLLLGYYIQSPQKGLKEVNDRISLFREKFSHTLQQLSDEKFDAYKKSLLMTLKQPAKNLQEEFMLLEEDWRRQHWHFDSHHALINNVQNVSLQNVQDLFKKIESGDAFGNFILQLRGTEFSHQEIIQPKDVTNIQDLDLFHKRQLEVFDN